MADREQLTITEEPWSRRSWLEWLGRTTVLTLGAELLVACGLDARPDDPEATDGGVGPDDAGTRAMGAGETGPEDAGGATPADAGPPEVGPSGSFPFQPGTRETEIYRGWPIRTVDPQDLVQLLRSWRLTVDGLVETPYVLDFAALVGLRRQDQVTDFHCVEGWSVLDVPWNGVLLRELLARAGVRPGATHVVFHTTGAQYNESLPLAVAREPRTLLAYGVAGATLPLDHGFPTRIVIPRLLGYKNAKYVERIELTDRPFNGFWVEAGYPYAGEVASNRLREGKY